MFPQDPRYWLPDPQVTPFEHDRVIDVQDPNLAVAGGSYVVYQYTVPESKYLVVKGWSPYARARQNTGELTEDFANLPAANFAGYGVFIPRILSVGGGSNLIKLDAVQPTTAAAPNNTQRTEQGGTTWTSDTPRRDAYFQAGISWCGIAVEPTKTFQILFQLIPAAAANPLPFRYTINPANAQKRVDFLGAVVVGVEVSKPYEGTVRAALNRDPNPA